MQFKSTSRKLPKSVKYDEFVSLMKKVPSKDKTIKVAFTLAYFSGLRISEIIKLQKENITKTHIEIWEAKGKVDRTAPMPKAWKAWMLDYIPIKVGVRALQRKFKKYSKLAGLPSNYTFHSLRHGFAIRCIEQGMPLNQLQAFMGHSDISITSIYTRARPEDALKSYEELF